MPTHLEIDEVTTGVSLSTETSPTIESTTPLNPKINAEKYKHLCQVEEFNPGELVHRKEPNQLRIQALTSYVKELVWWS